MGEAVLVVSQKKVLSYTVRREAEKGVSARKKISRAERGRCEICASCTKMGFQKKRLESGKIGSFRRGISLQSTDNNVTVAFKKCHR